MHRLEGGVITNMEATVILEWAFSPPNYFEEPIHIIRDQYDMIINNGKVEVRIKPEVYNNDPKMRDKLHKSLNDRFLGTQLVSHEDYKLSDSIMHLLHPDGRKDTMIIGKGGICVSGAGQVDFIKKDEKGNIIKDSKRERIDKKKQLSELTEKYCVKDPLVKSLLNSNSMSVKDPANELVHLYEIFEALSKHFGGEVAAGKALGVSNNKLRRLRKLANAEPLKQSRHRGNFRSLREATKKELNEARNIAQSLVESYLEYLEK
jgi:hypothetical protein